MSRIPTHTVEDAPAASRQLLQKIVQSTPTGRPANLHAQMAHSPAVLTAYTSLRAVLTEHTTFDPKVGAALTLATAAGVGNGYMIRIASRLAHTNGWVEEQVTALRKGIRTSDALSPPSVSNCMTPVFSRAAVPRNCWGTSLSVLIDGSRKNRFTGGRTRASG